MPATTAILLFSRLVGGHRLEEALVERTERTLAQTGLPVIRSNERTQHGTTFGERLAGEVAKVFAAGVERVIVVGNDCPSLQARHLTAAQNELERGRQVLGPDHRGGVYLLGLNRETFDAAAFQNLPWQTAELGRELQNYLGASTLLTTHYDINGLTDLVRNWRFFRQWFAGLADLIFEITSHSLDKNRAFTNVCGRLPAYRGPPSLA